MNTKAANAKTVNTDTEDLYKFILFIRISIKLLLLMSRDSLHYICFTSVI